MCGIAGLIHRGKSADVGSELTSMYRHSSTGVPIRLGLPSMATLGMTNM